MKCVHTYIHTDIHTYTYRNRIMCEILTGLRSSVIRSSTSFPAQRHSIPFPLHSHVLYILTRHSQNLAVHTTLCNMSKRESLRGIRTALSFLNSSLSSCLRQSARKLYSPSSSSSSSATWEARESGEEGRKNTL